MPEGMEDQQGKEGHQGNESLLRKDRPDLSLKSGRNTSR